MTGVTSNQQYQDPSWLSSFLQQHEGDKINVQQGPGGVTITVAGESVFIGPSQMGVLSTFKGHDVVITGAVNPADPFLMLPETSTFTVNPSWVNYFVSFISQGTQGSDSTDGPSFQSGGADIQSDLQLPVPKDLQSQDSSKVFNALLQYTQVSSGMGLDDNQKTAFTNALHQMASTIALSNKDGPIAELGSGNAQVIAKYLASIMPTGMGLSDGDMEIFQSALSTAGTGISAGELTSGLSATEGKDVYSSLIGFTGFEKDPNLSADQQKSFSALLNDLSTNIATQNASGKPDPGLQSFDAKTIGTTLLNNVDISSLSTDDQVLFKNYIGEASLELASLNAASGSNPPISPLMSSMQSTNETDVLGGLTNMLVSQGMSSDDITSIQPQLKALAATIAQANDTPGGSGLDICDATTLGQALAKMLGANNDPANAVLQTAIANLATSYAAENTTYYSMLAKSTDPAVVTDALVHLSNVMNDPNLTPAERQMAVDYLKAMALALAFMSKVRAQTSELEAQLRLAQNEGKRSTITDQTNAAKQTSESGLKNIQNNLEQQLHAIFMKELMAIIGPIVIVIMAIIAAIIAVFSFGTATAAACALLAIVIVLIVVAAVISIAEMETGFLEKAAKNCGINDKAGQDAFAAAIQAIISAILIVVTFGAGAAVVGAQAAAQGVIAALREGIKQLLSQIMQNLSKVIQEIVSQVLNILMSSGILADGFEAMFRACGMSEADAKIAAMVMTIVVSLAAVYASAKAAASAVSSVAKQAERSAVTIAEDASAQAAKAAEQDAAKAAEKQAELVIEQADDAAKAKKGDQDVNITAAPPVNGNTSTDVDSVVAATKKLLARKIAELQESLTLPNIKSKLKDPNTYLNLLQSIGAFTQVGATVGQAVGSVQQGLLERAQAELVLANSQTEALLANLKSVISTFDMTQKDLDASSKDSLKVYNDLMSLFANMVASASTIVQNTTQQG